MHVKNTPEIHFVYLGNREIYCIFMACCIISVLFSLKCCFFFFNFVFFFSNNTFLINHPLKFKYQPGQIEVKFAGTHMPTCALLYIVGVEEKPTKSKCALGGFSLLAN